MTAPSIHPERTARAVRRFVLTLGGVLLLALVILAACGNRDQDPAATQTPAAAPVAAETAPKTETVPASPVETATSAGAVTETTSAAAALPATATSALTGTAAVNAGAAVSPSAAEANAAPVCPIETSAELAGYSALHERMGCPVATATVESVGINEFGQGPDYDRFMLWFGNEQQIYVLQPDGAWLAYTDTWAENEAEILCNPDGIDPATSPPLPRRGFGKLWCTVESVRTAMGTIDREERLCQHAIVQSFSAGRLLACFEDATIRYFRLLGDGRWDMEMVQ